MKKYFFFIFIVLFFYTFAAERQVVISKIDTGLQNSDKYNFSTLSTAKVAKGVNGTSLDLILDFQSTGEKNFTYNSTTDRFNYPYTSLEKYLVFPVTYNSVTTIKTDSVKLIQEEYTSTNDLLTRVLIDETINLPASTISLTNNSGTNTGNLFTYTENSSIVQQHFEKYKNQQYMIRISKGTTDYDYDAYYKLNKINLAISNDVGFLNGTSDYIDFYFSGDDYTKIQKIITTNGLEATFVPGRIEIFGLPQGQYTIGLYSFRYSSEYADKGNVVITRESKQSFNSKTVNITNNLILKNFDSTASPSISGELVLISNAINPTYTIKEQLGTGAYTTITPTTSTMTPITTAFYYNSTTTITPNVSGYDAGTNKYYYKVNFTYTSPNATKDSTIRTVSFTSGSTTEYISYYVRFDTLPKITTYPYQTVIAQWKTLQNFGSDPYMINDKVMSPSTYGYRAVKYVNAATIKDTYLGNYTNSNSLSFNGTSYQWTGTSGNQQTIMFQKAISDSKGTYRKMGSSESDIFSFYTIKNIQSFIYEQERVAEIPENASFLWQDSLKSSYGVLVNDEELVFRITKLSSTSDTGLETKSYTVAGTSYSTSLPKYYLDIYNNTNPIGTYNETTNIENFISGSKPYLDLIFKKGEDRKIERANGIFNFFKDNKFEVIGLPRGNYMLQVYTVKGADLDTQKNGVLDYKTLTFELSKKFDIGLPELVYGNFALKNNIFLIESINVNSFFDINTNLPSKNITVNFVTKTSEAVSLTKDNLTAQNMEEIDGGPYKIDGKALAERHQNGTLTPVNDANLNLFKADKAPFQYPLDIIFLVDDSGSMQNEIDNVRDSLSSFTSQLEARGYNVKFNVITFGPDQNNRYSGIANNYPTGSWMSKIYQYQDSGYLAIYKEKWFDDVDEVKDAFSEMKAIWGYYNDQENGAQAIYNGANLLKNNGRYLDYNNTIVDHSSYQNGYIPSKKLLIFLTDENFDIASLNLIPGVTGSTNTQRYNSYRTLISNLIKSEEISLSGIYHIGTGNTDVLGNSGVTPADTGDRSYNEFISLLGSQFTRYEMGNNGQLVIDGLFDTVKNTGIIQRWILSYTSPFSDSDGAKRQVIYSLTGLTNTIGQPYSIMPYIKDSTKDRFYIVPEDKIESYFIKPDPIIKKLIKKDGKVQIQVKARSQYNEIQSDGTTKLVNYAIEQGSFKLTGNGNQLVLLSSKNEVSISPITDGWYTLTSSIDAPTYYSLFGDYSLDLESTVATKYFGKTTNLTTIELTEVDEPLVTGIKIQNETLKNLLSSLKDIENKALFSDTEIETLSSINYTKSDGFSKTDLDSYFATVNNKLNTKLGDSLSYEITVFDESITKLNATKIYLSGNDTAVTKISNIYKGSTTVNSTNLTMQISIYDDYGNVSALKNTGVSESFSPLIIPTLITKTNYNDGLYFSNINTLSTNSNTALLTPKTTNSEAIAYLLRFDYDATASDYGLFDDDSLVLNPTLYPLISGTKYWATSKNGLFNLYDGKYQTSQIYMINKAGGISEFSSNTLTGILTELSDISTVSENRSFHVDTVAPRIVKSYSRKISDANGVPITGNSLPFKENDIISYRYEVQEYNFDKIDLNYSEFLNKFIFQSETIIPNKTTIIDKNFKVVYNLIGNDENISLTSLIYDKANNSNGTSTTGLFSSKMPKQMEFVPDIFENSIKFTKNSNFLLNSFDTGEDIYYAEVALGSTGGAQITALPVNLSTFTLSAANNLYNIGTITTYSLSGQKGVPYVDGIVVDTEINDTSLPDIIARKDSTGNYHATIKFDSVKELVGLNGFNTTEPSVSVDNGTIDTSGYFPIFNSGYFTVPTASTILTSYSLQLPGGKISPISITLKDRLGNTKTFDQKIYYYDMVKIIGASNNSLRKINTVIELGNGNKIAYRTE